MSESFLEVFEGKIVFILDPENSVEELHKLDGSIFTDEEMALLEGFEKGWNEAFSTIAAIAGWDEEDGD